MHITAPIEITEHTRALAHARVGPDVEPQMLMVVPEPGCRPADCFENVRKKVLRDGGRIQFGWAVWEWPGVYFEAEHHAVYVAEGSSQFVDITPCVHGTKFRVFIPDDSAIYDFENEGVLRDNLRFSLVNDPVVDELFKAAARRAAFMNRLPGVGVIAIHASEDKELQKLERRFERANQAFVEKYAPKYGAKQ